MSVFTSRPTLSERRRATAAGRSGLVQLVAAGVCWGTGGLTGRLLGQSTGLSALAVATWRLAGGGLVILGWLLVRAGRGRGLRDRFRHRRRSVARIAQIGLLAALFQGCYFSAVALTSVSLATLITIGASPVLVLAFEQAGGRRRVGAADGAAVCLALAGLVLLIGWPSGSVSTIHVLLGAGLALCSAAGFATVSLVSTDPVPGLDGLTVTGCAFTLGGLLLAPLGATTRSGLLFHPTVRSLTLVLALALVPTALAYTLYFKGLATTAAGTATVIALLEPLTGTVLAAVFLGDRIGAAGTAGAALLAVAVVLTARTSAG